MLGGKRQHEGHRHRAIFFRCYYYAGRLVQSLRLEDGRAMSRSGSFEELKCVMRAVCVVSICVVVFERDAP